jgi:hypothetical protein
MGLSVSAATKQKVFTLMRGDGTAVQVQVDQGVDPELTLKLFKELGFADVSLEYRPEPQLEAVAEKAVIYILRENKERNLEGKQPTLRFIRGGKPEGVKFDDDEEKKIPSGQE